MTKKRDLAFYQSQPERYKIASSGAVYDLEIGRFCDMFPELNPYAITKETARAMNARKKQIVQLGALRGLASKVGVNLDEATLEQIAAGAGTAFENMAGHNYETFMKSNNLRGQGENLRALLALLGVEREELEVAHTHYADEAALKALTELRDALLDAGVQLVDRKFIE